MTTLEKAGINSPSALARVEHPSRLWLQPELLVGQTCGWPYANRLRGKVVPFARFVYDLPRGDAGHYYSVYIGRSQDDAKYLESREALLGVNQIAINGDDSQSGFHVFREILGNYPENLIPADKRHITGAHRNSVKAIANGTAEIAAIDAIAFELAKRHDPETVSKIQVIGYSNPLPGLPLITSLENAEHIPALYDSFKAAIDGLSSQTKDELLIKDIIPATDGDYEVFL